MQSKATSVEEYLKELTSDRLLPIANLRNQIKKNIPKGFIENMQYGMISFVVPHSIYPAGYHCNTKLALPFISLASQKNYISLYHMGVYADNDLGKWFINEFEKLNMGKLDMGKGCIRFKKIENIPFNLIGELVSKITVQEWIKTYEGAFLKSKK